LAWTIAQQRRLEEADVDMQSVKKMAAMGEGGHFDSTAQLLTFLTTTYGWRYTAIFLPASSSMRARA